MVGDMGFKQEGIRPTWNMRAERCPVILKRTEKECPWDAFKNGCIMGLTSE